MRSKKVILNTLSSLFYQLVAVVCGLIVPRLIIGTFGSEVYGATTSITQFLSYITLLEGGVGGVARAALYKPLAEKDQLSINSVMSETDTFFRRVAFAFTGYVVIIACSFKFISGGNSFEWIFNFALVFAIAIALFFQYFFGVSSMVIIQADQNGYISFLLQSGTAILNTVIVLILIKLNCGIIMVKLASSLIFIIRPVLLRLYVNKKYHIKRRRLKKGESFMTQKWDGLMQHVAFFLHTNTDIVVLTVFTGLKTVAVYSIYYMVVTSVEKIITSFTGSLEAAFGNMLAKNETEVLKKNLDNVTLINSFSVVILFSVAAVMLIPFVGLYTRNVTDTNYIQPLFGYLLLASEAVYCIRLPYYNLVTAAGHFRQTRMSAFIEAAANIVLSVMLVNLFGMCGVVAATLVAMLYRTIYYAYYLSKHILHGNLLSFFKRQLLNIACVAAIVIICYLLGLSGAADNYAVWIIRAVEAGLISCLVTAGLNALFYRSTMGEVFKKAFRMIKSK